MQLAIIGLPFSGKTTVFNAVTRGSAQVAGYSGVSRPNVGVAKVPDSRLAPLVSIYRPTRTTQAEIAYVDLPAAPDGLGRTKGISGEYLNRLQTADALVIVARAFEDPSVPDGGDGVDPFRDIETMLYELTFADLEILDRRLERIAQSGKGARGGDRDEMLRERESISRLKEGLDSGLPIRKQTLNQEDLRRVAEFQFLTAKPVIVVVNAGEDQMDGFPEIPRMRRGLRPRSRRATYYGRSCRASWRWSSRKWLPRMSASSGSPWERGSRVWTGWCGCHTALSIRSRSSPAGRKMCGPGRSRGGTRR